MLSVVSGVMQAGDGPRLGVTYHVPQGLVAVLHEHIVGILAVLGQRYLPAPVTSDAAGQFVGRGLACLVAVREDQALLCRLKVVGMVLQEVQLGTASAIPCALRQGHGVVYACLDHGKHVHLTLYEDDVLPVGDVVGVEERLCRTVGTEIFIGKRAELGGVELSLIVVREDQCWLLLPQAIEPYALRLGATCFLCCLTADATGGEKLAVPARQG